MPKDDPLRLAQDQFGTAERLVMEQKARIERLKAKGRTHSRPNKRWRSLK
jgi:hypothetical protein